MAHQEERTLTRECPATIIPSGEAVIIPTGATVSITHRLGGNYTVLWAMGMARIAGENADALGEERPENEGDKATTDLASGAAEHLGPPDETAIWEGLKSVYDPEIPVNIVDLGLVYSMDTKETESGEGYLVEVQMTLTAPGCGMGPAIASDAESRVSQVPGVREARVELVWDPPWNQEMISEEGKMHLGLI